MNWIKSIVVASGFCAGSLLPSVVWAQPTHQVVPVAGRTSVQGKVEDARTKQPIVGAMVLAKNQEGIVRAQQTTGADGVYMLSLDSKQSYIFTTKAEGYIALDEELSFTSEKTYQLIRKPTFLFRTGAQAAVPPPTVAASVATQPLGSSVAKPAPPVNTDNTRVIPPKTLDAKVVYTPPFVVAPLGKATQLQALQFVQSKAELLPDAQPALEQLTAFLREHPATEIELTGHTDNQGDFNENLKLSQQRVDVIKAYLVKSGIAANRIATKGYGPTRPIASNNRESTRQLNRRVEMTVVRQ